jgi:hypothetical protein
METCSLQLNIPSTCFLLGSPSATIFLIRSTSYFFFGLPNHSPFRHNKELQPDKPGPRTVAPLDPRSLLGFFRAMLYGRVSSSLIQVRQEILKLDTSWFQTSQVLNLSTQVRFRALCVIEALLRQGGGGGLATVSEHFRAQPAAVVENLDSPQASVREKAKKVGTSQFAF